MDNEGAATSGQAGNAPGAIDGQTSGAAPGASANSNDGAPSAATGPEGAGVTTPGTQTTGSPDGTGSNEGEGFVLPSQEALAAMTVDELLEAQKSMQGDYSRKMQEIADSRQKIEAFDSFMRDPMTQLQQLAGQYGFQLNPINGGAANGIAKGDGENGEPAEPQTWEQVYQNASRQAVQDVMTQLQPVLSQVQETRKVNVEAMLDKEAPDWRQYESEMTALLKQHPTLANNPTLLYQMALPPNVREARATEAAIKKMQQKIQSSHVGAGSPARKPASTPGGKVSFNDAVNQARKELQEKGLRPVG